MNKRETKNMSCFFWFQYVSRQAKFVYINQKVAATQSKKKNEAITFLNRFLFIAKTKTFQRPFTFLKLQTPKPKNCFTLELGVAVTFPVKSDCHTTFRSKLFT